MDEILTQMARHINELATKRKSFAEVLKQVDKLALASKLAMPIKEKKLDKIKICGVDGGFLKKEYHGAGLILRRAVAVCFEYKNGQLERSAYFPGRRPMPNVVFTGPELSETEFNQVANLRRTETELTTALKALEEFKPDVLVLDGSIVLHPSSVPEKSSSVYLLYKEIIALYRRLYETCAKTNIILIGAIEDCKGCRFCTTLQKQALPEFEKFIPEEFKIKLAKTKDVLECATDTLFLYYFLETGQRTQHLKYSDSAVQPILRDLGEKWSNAIFTTYLKAVEYDRPLRIEFLAPSNDKAIADQASAIIWQISRQNRNYAYPSVLIEADGRAKLQEHEIDIFKASLHEKVGNNPALFELRREMRPF